MNWQRGAKTHRIYKVLGSADTAMNVAIVGAEMRTAKSVVSYEVDEITLDTLSDIVGQALEYNEEDPTIGEWVVEDMLGLLSFIGKEKP